jgi:hypothetical protein
MTRLLSTGAAVLMAAVALSSSALAAGDEAPYGWSPRVWNTTAVEAGDPLSANIPWIALRDLRTGRGVRLNDHCPTGTHTQISLGQPIAAASGTALLLVEVKPDPSALDGQRGTAICRAVAEAVDPANTGEFESQMRLVRVSNMGRSVSVLGGPVPARSNRDSELMFLNKRLLLIAGKQAAEFDPLTQMFGTFASPQQFGLRISPLGTVQDPVDGGRLLPDGSRWWYERGAKRAAIQDRAGRVTTRRLGSAHVVLHDSRSSPCGHTFTVNGPVADAMIGADGKTVWALTSTKTAMRCAGQLYDVYLNPGLLRSDNGGRTWKLVAQVSGHLADSAVLAAVLGSDTPVLYDDYGGRADTRVIYSRGRFHPLKGHLTIR